MKISTQHLLTALSCLFLPLKVTAAPAQSLLTPDQQLVTTALEGSGEKVLPLLTNGASVNATVGPGLTAWVAAKMRGREGLAERLAQRGADTNVAFPSPDRTIDWIINQRVPRDAPGLALAVVREGRVVFEQGWGLASLDYDVPITPATVFHVASVSKQFTAFAIALLAADGKLSVDDDYRRHLPDMPDFGKTITLRHLLYHTSGLRDQWDLLALTGWRLDDVITQEDILKLMRRQRELNFNPGDEHLYCNSGYTLLAETAGKVSGKAFPQFMRERVFEPLCMTNTHFHLDHEQIVRNMAYSYNSRSGGGYKKSVLSYANVGATSLFTTVEDLARWIANFEHPTVGNASLLAQMWESGKLNNGTQINYGFGFALGEFRKARTISHSGGDAGYRSFLLWLPDHHLGVALLSNLGSVDVGSLAHLAAEAYLYPALAAEPERRRPSANPPAYRLDPALLDRYVGKYSGQSGRIISVVREGDQLKGDVVAGRTQALVPTNPHQFALAESDGRVLFEAAESGKAARYTLNLDGETRVYSRVQPGEQVAPPLDEYSGTYHSEELDLNYAVRIKDGGLIVAHRRHDEIPLRQTSRDHFNGPDFGTVRFDRDADGKINVMFVTTGRVRNLRFVR